MRKVLLLFLVCIVIPSWADTIDLNLIVEGELVKPSEIGVFEDTSSSLSFQEVQELDAFVFSDVIPSVENVGSNYWLRLNFKNDSSRKWVLEVLSAHTQFISFYQPQKKRYNIQETGHLLDKDSRQYQHKNFVFDLDHSDFSKPFFIKIKSDNKVGFYFKIQDQQTFSGYSLREYLLLGIYYGILILLVVYHAVIFTVIRDKVYLFYALTVFVAGMLSLSDDGLGILYVWDHYKGWSQALGLYILPSLFLIFFAGYSRFFLGNRFQKGKQYITYAVVGYFIIFLIQLIIQEEKVYFSSLYSLPFLVIYGVYVYAYFKQKYKPAIYFLIGFSFSLFGIVINQLRLLGVIDGNAFTVYAFNIGIVLEFLSLALSISYKNKDERRLKKLSKLAELKLIKEKQEAQELMLEAVNEKERVTQEINKTLEVKIVERTSQLNDLISKLKEMNLEYDKENWNLKRSVQAERQSKLKEEKSTLKDILEVYPNPYKCNEFLASLKWQDEGYTCPKCNYEKYSIHAENFSRKCSRCSSSNSVTKGSLFQAQKLPLNKLFYVTYLWHSSNKINVQELSKELQISEVSLYKFIAKIKAKMDDKNKQKEAVNSWIDLIF